MILILHFVHRFQNPYQWCTRKGGFSFVNLYKQDSIKFQQNQIGINIITILQPSE